MVDPNKEPESSTKSSHQNSEDNLDSTFLNKPQIALKPKLLGFAVPEDEKKGDIDERNKPKPVLSEKQLELSVKDDYSHETLNIMTDAEKHTK